MKSKGLDISERIFWLQIWEGDSALSDETVYNGESTRSLYCHYPHPQPRGTAEHSLHGQSHGGTKFLF